MFLASSLYRDHVMLITSASLPEEGKLNGPTNFNRTFLFRGGRGGQWGRGTEGQDSGGLNFPFILPFAPYLYLFPSPFVKPQFPLFDSFVSETFHAPPPLYQDTSINKTADWPLRKRKEWGKVNNNTRCTLWMTVCPVGLFAALCLPDHKHVNNLPLTQSGLLRL